MAGLTIQDLMQRFNLERRAIHAYFRHGLVDKPPFKGRFTEYTEEHAERIRAICHLIRIEKHSIAEAKRRLRSMTAEEITRLGRPPVPVTPAPALAIEAWVRTALVAGVELHVSTTATPEAKRLADAILALHRGG